MERNDFQTKNGNEIRKLADKIGKIGRIKLVHGHKAPPKSLICAECGLSLTNYNYTPHFRKHNLTKDQYFIRYPNQLVKIPKNYICIRGQIIHKWIIRKDYKNLTLSQMKLVLLVRAYHVDKPYNIRSIIVKDLMTNAIHQSIIGPYEKFEKYKEIHNYLIENFRKTGETIEYFTIRYGNEIANRKLQEKSNRVSGDKNPGFQHNGKFSAWSKNFIHGYNEERHLEKKQQQSNWVRNNTNKNFFHYDYWVEQANGNEKLAKELYTKSQTKNLDWFINKYGEEEGKQRHKDKTEKWIKSCKRCNFSKISQELFNGIAEKYKNEHIYYATFDQKEMIGYKNKEYFLQTKNSWVRPDFIDTERKKVIEFDGDYWHSDKKANPTKERERDLAIMQEGFQILHIPERDYNKDKDGTIDKCLEFLRLD